MLSLSYILEVLCLKNYVNHMVNLLIIYMESNVAEKSAPAQPQQMFWKTLQFSIYESDARNQDCLSIYI